MSSDDIAIAVRGVSKQYKIQHQNQRLDTLIGAFIQRFKHGFRSTSTETFWALKHVNFEVKRGDVLGVIGRNGAGKSTLLKVMSRITEPTDGEIEMHGRVGSLLEVGTGFHPDLTGRENIFLNGAILGMKRDEIQRQFDAIVDFSEVEKFLDTPVKRYSSGMYTRLAFAVAAHLQPEILIVDEVLSVGDATFQKKCLGKMKDIAGQGRTVLFVSHNMAAVRELCSSAIWLQGGTLLQRGPSGDVVDSYLAGTSKISGLTELTHCRRLDTHGNQLRLTSISFNRGGPPFHGEPLSAVISFDTMTDLDEVVISFGFASRDGTRILSLDSDLGGPRIKTRGGCHGTVEVLLDRLDLQPGSYLLQIGARSGMRHMLDLISEDLEIDILPGPETPSFIIGQKSGVRAPSRWIWQTEETPKLAEMSGNLSVPG